MVTANLNATADRIPIGRFGDTQEVAQAALMLAGNGYVTGRVATSDRI
jgi:3-oxoacyl-[acyl-carrier protein] reductase